MKPYTTARASPEDIARAAKLALPHVGEAELVLDHLESGAPVSQLRRGDHHISIAALVAAAVKSWRARFPHNTVKQDWCGKTGIWRHSEGRESHYDCLFCGESLATIGRGTVGRLAPKFVEKLDRHVRRCALIWIAAEADRDRFEIVEDAGRGRSVATTADDYNENLENHQPDEGVEES